MRIVAFAKIVSGIMSNAWLYSCLRCKMLADSLAALDKHMVIEHEGSSDAEAFSVAMNEANNMSSVSEFFLLLLIILMFSSEIQAVYKTCL